MRAASLAALGLSALLAIGAAAWAPGVSPIAAMVVVAVCGVLVLVHAFVGAPDPPSRAYTDATARVLALETEGARIYREHAGVLAPALAAQKEHDQLLDGLAHELKTPLNSIRGFADVLLEEIDGPLSPEIREEVVLIRDAGLYLHTLVDEVLDVASGRRSEPDAMSPVDLAPILRDVARMLLPRAMDKGLELRVDAEQAVRKPRADARRVRQIVTNLALNAVKYTKRGHVVLALGERSGDVLVSVDDTGPGIAEVDRDRIFTAWERAGEHGPDGHGLGLAISKELATGIGCTIELESEVGRGSRFTLVFPAGVT